MLRVISRQYRSPTKQGLLLARGPQTQLRAFHLSNRLLAQKPKETDFEKKILSVDELRKMSGDQQIHEFKVQQQQTQERERETKEKAQIPKAAAQRVKADEQLKMLRGILKEKMSEMNTVSRQGSAEEEEELISRLEEVLSHYETPEETQERITRENAEYGEAPLLPGATTKAIPKVEELSGLHSKSTNYSSKMEGTLETTKMSMKALSEKHKKDDLDRLAKDREDGDDRSDSKALTPKEKVDKAKGGLRDMLSILKGRRKRRMALSFSSKSESARQDREDELKEKLENFGLEDLLFTRRQVWDHAEVKRNFLRVLSLETAISRWIDKDMPVDEYYEESLDYREKYLYPALNQSERFQETVVKAIEEKQRKALEDLEDDIEKTPEERAQAEVEEMLKQEAEIAEIKAKAEEEAITQEKLRKEKEIADEEEKKRKLADPNYSWVSELSQEELEELYKENIADIHFQQVEEYIRDYPTPDDRKLHLKKIAQEYNDEEILKHLEEDGFARESYPGIDKYWDKPDWAERRAARRHRIITKMQASAAALMEKTHKIVEDITREYKQNALAQGDNPETVAQKAEYADAYLENVRDEIAAFEKLLEEAADTNEMEREVAAAEKRAKLLTAKAVQDEVDYIDQEALEYISHPIKGFKQEVMRKARAAGIERVWIGDGPANQYHRIFSTVFNFPKKGGLWEKLDRLRLKRPFYWGPYLANSKRKALLKQKAEEREAWLQGLAQRQIEIEAENKETELQNDMLSRLETFTDHLALLEAQMGESPELDRMRTITQEWNENEKAFYDQILVDPQVLKPYEDIVDERNRVAEEERLRSLFPVTENVEWNEEFKKSWFSYRGEILPDPEAEARALEVDQEEAEYERNIKRHEEVMALYFADHPEELDKPLRPATKKVKSKSKKKTVRYLTIDKYKALEKKGKLAAQLRGHYDVDYDVDDVTADHRALILGGGKEEKEETEDYVTLKIQGQSQFISKVRTLFDKFKTAITPDAHIAPIMQEFGRRVPWFQLEQYKRNLATPMVSMAKAYLEGNPTGLKNLPFSVMEEAVKLREAREAKGIKREIVIVSSSSVDLVWTNQHEDGTPILGFRIELLIEEKDADEETIYIDASADVSKTAEVMLLVSATEEKGPKFSEQWLPAGEKVFVVKVEEPEKARDQGVGSDPQGTSDAWTDEQEAKADEIIRARRKAREEARKQERS